MSDHAVKRNVLFLCTGNSARSQMAEGLLRAAAADRFEVFSAGSRPAEAVHPLAVEALREIGIDISHQKPKGVRTFLGHILVHHLIVVCASADNECPVVWPGLRDRLLWPFNDPAAVTGTEDERLAAFRRARDEIKAQVEAWLRGDGKTFRQRHTAPLRASERES